MTEIEKMKRYISNTPKVSDRYEVGTRQLIALMKGLSEFDALDLAFEYGRAKGYRAAKAEVRR